MTHRSAKPIEVKDWAIVRLKKGYSAIRTAKDIKQHFGVYVSSISVGSWRKQYNERNNDKIPALRIISNVRKPEKAKELAITLLLQGCGVPSVVKELKQRLDVSASGTLIRYWRKEYNERNDDKIIKPTKE